MKRIFMLAAVLGVTGVLVSAQSVKPMDLYQEGLYLQEVKGDLPKAIEVYQSIVTRYASDRAVVSRALFQLATCYETLGQPEALNTYQRVVREFAGETAVAAAARTKVAAMSPVRAQSDALAPRRILALDRRPTFGADISPSGGQLVTSDGDLVMHDTGTGQRTVLVAASATGRADLPVFSRDGRQVAYLWRSAEDTHLGTIGVETGAKPRRLVALQKEPRAAIPEVPIGWASDGRSILVVIEIATQPRTVGLAWVSVSDGTIRVARSLGPVRIRQTPRLSPDGRFVAYSSVSGSNEEVPTGRNLPYRLFVASVDGTSETEVVTTAGSHTNPVWTPDGSHLLFASDRGGAKALWSVPIQGGAAVGGASQVLAGFSDNVIGISQSGTLFSIAVKGDSGSVTHIAERGLGGRVVSSFPGGGGDWSPDGRLFAFKPRNGLGSEVIVRSMDTGAERSFKRENIAAAAPHWLGNAGFVINVQGEPQGSGEVLHFVDVASGSFERLYSNRIDELDRWSFSTPDDGAKVFQLLKKVGPGQPIVGVVAVDPATGANGQVAMFPEPLQAQGVPAFDVSADGQSLVVAWRAVGQGAVPVRMFTIQTDGTGYRPIGEPFLGWGNLSDTVRWTPDGSAILFVVAENPGLNPRARVMRIPAGGGKAEFEGVEVAGPIFNIDPSPDGSRIAYSTNPPVVTELSGIDNILSALR